MNEELKKQLLGKLPFSGEAKETFTPEIHSDLPEDYQPKITIKPMNKPDRNECLKFEAAGEWEKIYPIIKKYILSIDNLYDIADEKYITYSEEKFDILPDTMILEIYKRLSAISGLRTLEKKSL